MTKAWFAGDPWGQMKGDCGPAATQDALCFSHWTLLLQRYRRQSEWTTTVVVVASQDVPDLEGQAGARIFFLSSNDQ